MRSLFGDVVMRSQFGMLGVRSLLWRCWGCDRFWGVGMRSLLVMCGVRSLFGMWECDRFWDVGMRSLLGCGRVIAGLGMLGVRSLF